MSQEHPESGEAREAREPQMKSAHYASEKGEVVLRPHEYDGIQEYDQTLPNWWLFIFFSALLAFPVYWLLYYQFGLLPSDQERVSAQISKIEEVKFQALERMLSEIDDAALVNEWATNETVVNAGREVYVKANCSACHGVDLTASMDRGDGQMVAMSGLSLKDGEWKYGAAPMDVFNIILKGSPPESPGHNGARMQAWDSVISPMEIAQLTAFLIAENPEDFKGGGR